MLNNNYSNNQINQSNLHFSINNSDNNRDIFKKKNYHKNISSNITKNDIKIDENTIKKDRYKNSLNKRKENLNKFLFYYRYKSSKYKEKKDNFISVNNSNNERIEHIIIDNEKKMIS